MYIAIACMIVGLLIGRLFRSRIDIPISKVIMVVICLLLFILGLELGANNQLMSNLPTLGFYAFTISFLALLGSIICAKIIYKYIVKK